jgi:hypothetical protein
MAVAWPTIEGQRIGKVLRSSTWGLELGVISDQTRSGKSKTRAGHTQTPNQFSITIRFTLDEYRVFVDWFNNICRKGVNSFAYPQIDDITGVLREYRITSASSVSNIAGHILDLQMGWEQL